MAPAIAGCRNVIDMQDVGGPWPVVPSWLSVFAYFVEVSLWRHGSVVRQRAVVMLFSSADSRSHFIFSRAISDEKMRFARPT